MTERHPALVFPQPFIFQNIDTKPPYSGAWKSPVIELHASLYRLQIKTLPSGQKLQQRLNVFALGNNPTEKKG